MWSVMRIRFVIKRQLNKQGKTQEIRYQNRFRYFVNFLVIIKYD